MDTKISNLRKISYGLYAIGTIDGERPTGCIVNTVFQITSENPIIAISMNRNNYTFNVIDKTKRFSVSTLSESTPEKVISQLGFASGREKDKFQELNYEIKGGLPVVTEKTCGSFTCNVISMTETPTHFVILASVDEAFAGDDLPPMTYRYYHEVMKGSAPKNAPSYVAPQLLQEDNSKTEKWECDVCGYVYEGDLTKEPDTYRCPICGANHTKFNKI